MNFRVIKARVLYVAGGFILTPPSDETQTQYEKSAIPLPHGERTTCTVVQNLLRINLRFTAADATAVYSDAGCTACTLPAGFSIYLEKKPRTLSARPPGARNKETLQ